MSTTTSPPVFHALTTFLSVQIRRYIRPFFQASDAHRAVYAVITFFVKCVAFGYFGYPFILLDFWPSFDIYR